MDWIKVSEKLPEDEQHVIIYDVYGNMWFDVLFDGETKPSFYDEATDNVVTLNEVTHWLPLPDPPKED